MGRRKTREAVCKVERDAQAVEVATRTARHRDALKAMSLFGLAAWHRAEVAREEARDDKPSATLNGWRSELAVQSALARGDVAEGRVRLAVDGEGEAYANELRGLIAAHEESLAARRADRWDRLEMAELLERRGWLEREVRLAFRLTSSEKVRKHIEDETRRMVADWEERRNAEEWRAWHDERGVARSYADVAADLRWTVGRLSELASWLAGQPVAKAEAEADRESEVGRNLSKVVPNAGRRRYNGGSKVQMTRKDAAIICAKAGVKTRKGAPISERWIRAVEDGWISSPWYPGRTISKVQMANLARAEARMQADRPDVVVALGDRSIAMAENRKAKEALRTGDGASRDWLNRQGRIDI